MSTPKPNNSELLEALSELETNLETPFVPGELEDWVDHVRNSLDRVDPLLREQIETVHKSELQEIGEVDAELFQRVDQLQGGDEDSLAQLATLENLITTLDETSLEIEPHETQFKQHLDDLQERGLEFVIHVRTQEVALRTWLQEAFDRDRGTLD